MMDSKSLDQKDPSPMVGLRIFHGEWLTKVENLSEMDVSGMGSSGVHAGSFHSPGLFVSEDGFGKNLLLQRLGQVVDVDTEGIKRYFPKSGHGLFIENVSYWSTFLHAHKFSATIFTISLKPSCPVQRS